MFSVTGTSRKAQEVNLRMVAALIVLLLILLLFGGGGFAVHILWYILVAAVILWVIGFFVRSAEGGGRWYRW